MIFCAFSLAVAFASSSLSLMYAIVSCSIFFSTIANNSSFAAWLDILATLSKTTTCLSISSCNFFSFSSNDVSLSATLFIFSLIWRSFWFNASSRKFKLSSLRNNLFSNSIDSCLRSLISFSASTRKSWACVFPSNTACFTRDSASFWASFKICSAFCWFLFKPALESPTIQPDPIARPATPDKTIHSTSILFPPFRPLF